MKYKSAMTTAVFTILIGLTSLSLSETGSAQDRTWVPKSPMLIPTSVTNNVGVADGMLYVVGGVDNGGPSANVQAYNPRIDTWALVAPLPTSNFAPAVGDLRGDLYAVGGYTQVDPTSSTVASVDAYDPVSNAWSAKAAMPTARYGLGVAAVNGKLYAVGGFTGNGTPLATVEAYNPVNQTWTTRASMPTPRGSFGLSVMDGILYVVGGEGGPSAGTAVEAYDPRANIWTIKPSMPTARSSLAVGVANGTLYAVGGSNGGELRTVESYDPPTGTWATEASLVTARGSLGAATVNGVLYAVGGVIESSNTLLSTNEGFIRSSILYSQTNHSLVSDPYLLPGEVFGQTGQGLFSGLSGTLTSFKVYLVNPPVGPIQWIFGGSSCNGCVSEIFLQPTVQSNGVSGVYNFVVAPPVALDPTWFYFLNSPPTGPGLISFGCDAVATGKLPPNLGHLFGGTCGGYLGGNQTGYMYFILNGRQ